MISPCPARAASPASPARSGGTLPATVSQRRSRAFGPEMRITATPDGGLPLDSAKIVSGNCICAGLPIALTSCPTQQDGTVACHYHKQICWRKRPAPICASTRTIPCTGAPGPQATLAEARELDRPILLSVGYAACHWCHVMAHESFEDAEVAGLMNRLYVNIKVDREERPDIDQIYMAALERHRRAGRLAADHVPDAGRQALLGRHLFPEAAALRPAGLHAGAGSRSIAPGATSAASSTNSAQTLNNHVESTAVRARTRRRADRARQTCRHSPAASIR